MIPKWKHHDHTKEHSKEAEEAGEAEKTEEAEKTGSPGLFSDELIGQLPAQVRNKDAESVPGESGLAGRLKKQLAERMPA